MEDVPGFKEFDLVKDNKKETHTLCASHSTLSSGDNFLNWTKSDAFCQTHKGAGEHSDVYLGHPEFEGFEVII